jgi:hypothetical protein
MERSGGAGRAGGGLRRRLETAPAGPALAAAAAAPLAPASPCLGASHPCLLRPAAPRAPPPRSTRSRRSWPPSWRTARPRPRAGAPMPSSCRWGRRPRSSTRTGCSPSSARPATWRTRRTRRCSSRGRARRPQAPRRRPRARAAAPAARRAGRPRRSAAPRSSAAAAAARPRAARPRARAAARRPPRWRAAARSPAAAAAAARPPPRSSCGWTSTSRAARRTWWATRPRSTRCGCGSTSGRQCTCAAPSRVSSGGHERHEREHEGLRQGPRVGVAKARCAAPPLLECHGRPRAPPARTRPRFPSLPPEQPPGAGKNPKDMSKKAVLLSGPPGIGKTSAAHIVAK